MISSVRGSVLHLGLDAVVIEVGGVGLSVAVPPEVCRTVHLGDQLFLHTMLIVREDALSLYGFLAREELELFSVLLSVSGVGPKSALGVLSALSVEQIATAVANEDDAPFRKVSGIGPKTAKLIVVQLAGKIAPPVPGDAAARTAAVVPDTLTQVTAALQALGWPERTAVEAAGEALAHAPEAELSSVPALLRRALQQLGPASGGAARG